MWGYDALGTPQSPKISKTMYSVNQLKVVQKSGVDIKPTMVVFTK